MHQLKFTLKQHTPLIHFQHSQDGATLRATEVKPKLDRFILMKLGKEADTSLTDNEAIYNKGIEVAKNKKWLIDNEKGALNYKMRIWNTEPTSIKKYFFTSNPNSTKNEDYSKVVKSRFGAEYINKTQYFANNSNLKRDRIEKLEDVKLGIYWDSLEASTQTFKEDLSKEIKKNLIEFFLSSNFASRQSKGFGCFTIIKIEDNFLFDEKDLLKCFTTVYKLETKINHYNEALQRIANIYKLIRSGQGERESGGYKKSLLFQYFVGKLNPIRWEKRTIKQNINSKKLKYKKVDGTYQDINLTYTREPCYDDTNNKSWVDTPSAFNYQYIRALLGLNETFEFLADKIIDKGHDGKDKDITFKYIVNAKSNNGIDRFQSPIICKFIDGHIYFCCNPISNEILSKTGIPVSFNFDLKLKKNNVLQDKTFYKRDNFITNLETPVSFDVSDFLKYCFEDSPKKIDGFVMIK